MLRDMTERRLSAQEARECARRAAEMLARDLRVKLVYLFGSSADPNRREVRDLDLALLTKPPLSLEELLELRADLARHIGVDLDLVPLDAASIVLASEVAETGVCLFARDPDVETDFVVRVRARYPDFEPLPREQWRLAGERSKERESGS